MGGVPYFELVRFRTERFITNVVFENLPFLALQIWFYHAIASLRSDDLTAGGFVFVGTVLSSLLSILFNGAYYFSYKGNISLPIAVYQLHVDLQCNDVKLYWRHSIWK